MGARDVDLGVITLVTIGAVMSHSVGQTAPFFVLDLPRDLSVPSNTSKVRISSSHFLDEKVYAPRGKETCSDSPIVGTGIET